MNECDEYITFLHETNFYLILAVLFLVVLNTYQNQCRTRNEAYDDNEDNRY